MNDQWWMGWIKKGAENLRGGIVAYKYKGCRHDNFPDYDDYFFVSNVRILEANMF